MASSPSDSPPRAVFLSYAREDTEAAKRIADALRAFGVEVWFDQSELRGGDQWDQKIRTQIKTCALFVPIISSTTEARPEGYFRREWLLAAERTRDMASGVAFIVPVVTDDTPEGEASVPDEFMRFQWTRLAHGVPSPQFVEQIKRLLESPRKATSTRAAASNAPRATEKKSFPPIVAAVAAVVVLGIGALLLNRKSEPTTALSTNNLTARAKTPPADSEARQLVAKARALVEPWDFATHDDFILAEQLLKRAVDLDPSNAEAWAVRSLLSCGILVFNYDNAPARRDAARADAERAVKLAPDLDLARFARAFSYRFQTATRDESLRLLREEAARQPQNRFVVRTLGTSLRALGHPEEALVYLDRAAALPGGDAIAHYNRSMALVQLNRPIEAEAAIDQALALVPQYGQALGQKIRLTMDLHGDLELARELIDKIPPPYLLDDRGAAIVSSVWLLAHEWNKCIASLAAAHDYMLTSYYTGPKGSRIGLAHRGAGHFEAARTEWRAALQIVEKRLVAQSTSINELWDKALLLALLGERTESERSLALYEQLRNRTLGRVGFDTWNIYIALGRHDEVIALFESALKNSTNALSRGWLALHLRRDSELDPLRGNPRFDALLQSLPPEKK